MVESPKTHSWDSVKHNYHHVQYSTVPEVRYLKVGRKKNSEKLIQQDILADEYLNWKLGWTRFGVWKNQPCALRYRSKNDWLSRSLISFHFFLLLLLSLFCIKKLTPAGAQ